MNKPLRIVCVLLLLVVMFAVAGVSACSCGNSTDFKKHSITGEQQPSSENGNATTKTNPNDDGFGTEVGM